MSKMTCTNCAKKKTATRVFQKNILELIEKIKQSRNITNKDKVDGKKTKE